MNWKRLLGTDEGWTAALGTVALIGFGGFILLLSVADLREAARLEPVERACAQWLQDPSGPRWVTLTGCKLDIAEAASRKWKGWVSLRDGGQTGQRYLELFVPLFAGDAPPGVPSAVLATTDQKLLSLMDGIDRIAPEDVAKYLNEHQTELADALEPTALTGYVEPVRSMAARSALSVLMASDAVVLEQGKRPPRANALFGAVVGLVAVALGIRAVARRLLLSRESGET